jgi:hypothetical protein
VEDKLKNSTEESNDLSSRVNFEIKRKSCGPGVAQAHEQHKATHKSQIHSPSSIQEQQQMQAFGVHNYSSNQQPSRSNQSSHLLCQVNNSQVLAQS